MSEETTTNAAEESKKSKKLSKVYEGDVLVVTEGTTGKVVKFDISVMPENVNLWAKKHGYSQKLGDAAAGKVGDAAIDAMQKVYDGLVKGDLTVRAPATEKISKKSIIDNYNAMPAGKEKTMAKNLLATLGITVE